MVRSDRDRISGVVEVDETYVGGEKLGKRGHGALDKALVVIAAQEEGNHIGRIRLTHVPDASGASLGDAIMQMVAPGSKVKTDDWKGYNGIEELGYRRKIIRSTSAVGENLLPNCPLVASLLKRWILERIRGPSA